MACNLCPVFRYFDTVKALKQHYERHHDFIPNEILRAEAEFNWLKRRK